MVPPTPHHEAEPPETTDAEILRLLQADQDRGVLLLLERHGGRVAGYLKGRFRSLDEHELHDVLVDALLALPNTYDAARGSLGPWLLLLAHQQAVLRTRRRKRDSGGNGTEAVDRGPGPEETAQSRERLERLQQALDQLAPLEKAVMQADLEAGEAAPAEQLAERFNTTTRSVYNARTRARKKLLDRHQRGELF